MEDFLIENGILINYYGDGGDVVIPDSVTEIGEGAFKDCAGVTSVTLPDSVTSVSSGAFENCSNLTKVVIGAGVCEFDASAFFDANNKLKSIIVAESNPYFCSEDGIVYNKEKTELVYCQEARTGEFSVPAGVTRIGAYALGYLEGLTGVVLPDSVTEIGEGAFSDCSGLTSITIPDSVTEIGDFAFAGCAGLTSVVIPAGVTEIGAGAFLGCKGLTTLVVDKNNAAYDSRNDCAAIIETATNTLIAGCKDTVIPDSVTRIGEWAFYDCTGLTSIKIPAGVTEIGMEAFAGCTGLTSVTIPDSVTKLGKDAFADCAGLTSITIPDGVTEIGEWAFCDCTGLTSIKIPAGVTEIGEGTFAGCAGLTSVVIPAGVTEIGAGAFFRCTGLTSVTLPDSVTEIGEKAFLGCTGLTSITIPDSVKIIAENALFDCAGLTSLKLGAGIREIGTERHLQLLASDLFQDGSGDLTWSKSPFFGCENLAGFSVSEDNPYLCSVNGALYNKERTKLLYCPPAFSGVFTVPDGVTEIGDCAFYHCSKLTGVVFPDSVTKIDRWVFSGCSSLTSLKFPDSVTKVSCHALWGCDGLTSLELGTGFHGFAYHPLPDEPDQGPLYGVNHLASISVSEDHPYLSSVNGVLYNKERTILYSCPPAFSGAFTVPDGVTDIWNYAFCDCPGLTSVKLPESLEDIGNSAFCGCTGLTSITIPAGVKDIYHNAFDGCTGLTSVAILGATEVSPCFRDCPELRSLTINSGVVLFDHEDGSFANCNHPTDVFFAGTEAQWQEFVNENFYEDDPFMKANIHFIPERT